MVLERQIQNLIEQGIHKPAWQVGDCFRHKNPYKGEPEYMIIGVNEKFEGYNCISLKDGKTGWKTTHSFGSVHVFHNNLTRPELNFDIDSTDSNLIDSLF